MSEPSPSNRDQAELWNAATGAAWVELQDLLDRLFAPIETRVVEAGFPGEGGRVLDLGCGAGATTLAMARRLGPDGHCLGIDISQSLVDAAGRRARAAAVLSATFLSADAQTYPFEPAGFDAVVSRFGVMFFDDPVSAFSNVRRALRADGKLAFAAWRSRAENPFMTTAAQAAAPLLPILPAPEPDAPGQFAFARPDRVGAILSRAGWKHVDVQPMDVHAALPEQDLARFVGKMGPVGLALQALDERARASIIRAVLPAFDPFIRNGVANFGMACWLASARA